MSQIMTPLPIHEEKIHEEKEDHAAAANLSDPASEGLTVFSEILAHSLEKAEHPGIRAAQFTDLNGLAETYEETDGLASGRTRRRLHRPGGSRESRGVRNVVGFARRIAEDVLRDRRGLCGRSSREPPPASVSGSSRERDLAPQAPDWSCCIWRTSSRCPRRGRCGPRSLKSCDLRWPRPAFETWLAGCEGWGACRGTIRRGRAGRLRGRDAAEPDARAHRAGPEGRDRR